MLLAGVVTGAKYAGCDIGVTEGVLGRAALRTPGEPAPNKQLFKIAALIPVSVLNITLDAKTGFGIFMTPHVHVPCTNLSLIDLCLTGYCDTQ